MNREEAEREAEKQPGGVAARIVRAPDGRLIVDATAEWRSLRLVGSAEPGKEGDYVVVICDDKPAG